MNSTLENLPTELFRTILNYLTPEDVISLSLTCRRLNRVTCDEQVWHNYFFNRYQYFCRTLEYTEDEYLSEVAIQLRESSNDATWQQMFKKRANNDKHIRDLLNEIVSNRQNRIYNIELISSTYGLLAIDVLKRYFVSPSVSIANRCLQYEYYSIEIIRFISRELGVNLLFEMKNRQDLRTDGKALINALYIIQCFHPHGIFLSLNRLRTIGNQIVNDPIFSNSNLHNKCQLILSKMNEEKFLPANGDYNYYDIENSFLYSTFNGKPTIPLTMVAIFCALAEECQLLAQPMGFPGEVMAQVNEINKTQTPLIISVFEGKIMNLEQINQRLEDVLDAPLNHPITVTPIRELIIRSARNMINCITTHSRSALNAYGLYAAFCILKILESRALPFSFGSMLSVLKESFPMDIRFFELLLSSMTETNADLRRIRAEDSNPTSLPIKMRSPSAPKFYVGQICKHVYYNEWAVIYGWDLTCAASTLWQMHMGVSNLARTTKQPFYHVLTTSSSRHYVAEDNINIVAFDSIENMETKSTIVQQLCNADGIGKYFNCFDFNLQRFVLSNELKQEYSD